MKGGGGKESIKKRGCLADVRPGVPWNRLAEPLNR
jgi:hypothetical protein